MLYVKDYFMNKLNVFVLNNGIEMNVNVMSMNVQ